MQKKLSAIRTIILGGAALVLGIALNARLGVIAVVIDVIGGLMILYGAFLFNRAFLKKKTGKVSGEISADYRRKSCLLSKQEMQFYSTLRGIMASSFLVLPQMAIIGCIDKLTQTSYRNELFRIADFCIADALTLSPLLLIELNDASHKRADRIERDKKVREICDRAGMPLITIDSNEMDDVQNLKKLISKNILKN